MTAEGIGRVIAELRKAPGWSQDRLATELSAVSRHATVTRECVSRWENGRRTPRSFWLMYLATVLQVPLQVLEEADVRRRDFITSVAATTVAPLISSELIHYGFAAALADHPSIDDWEATTERYGRDYMTLGAAEIQRRLAADMVVLQQQLESPKAWAVAAKLMTLYGKTIPGSDGAEAIKWYAMAATAADRSGDDDLRVWVRGRAAIALGYEGASLLVAERFAEQAMAISDRPSLGRLNAVMGGAHAAALQGDRARARLLHEEGRRVHGLAGSHEQQSDYAVPHWRMGVFESLLLARLGDERGALAAQDSAAATLPASLPRFATHLRMHRGLMMARAGDRAGGVAFARAALDELPPEKHSLTLRLLMAEVEAP